MTNFTNCCTLLAFKRAWWSARTGSTTWSDRPVLVISSIEDCRPPFRDQFSYYLSLVLYIGLSAHSRCSYATFLAQSQYETLRFYAVSFLHTPEIVSNPCNSFSNLTWVSTFLFPLFLARSFIQKPNPMNMESN